MTTPNLPGGGSYGANLAKRRRAVEHMRERSAGAGKSGAIWATVTALAGFVAIS